MTYDPAVSNMLAYVNQGAVIQTVLAKDTASTTYGNNDGVTLCGTRSYSISPTTHSFLTLSGDTLTLQSVDPAEATTSPITITISATLDSYTSIPAAVQTFYIEIMDHCDTTTLSFDPALTDMLAYVNQGAVT